jgi:DNA polymerase-3 subunit beta
VAFAASSDEARPVLQGVFLNVVGNEITLAATDGFRISVRRAELAEPVPAPMSAIIPARALNELARIASDPEQTVKMIIPPGRGQVLFHLKDAELVSQLIDGNFPDYKAIVPRSFSSTTILTTAAFQKACRQAEIIARDGNYVVRLNIQPGGAQPGKVEITAQSEETGSSENCVEANVDGQGMVIAFNVRFLREVLDVIKTPSVALLTNKATAPGMLQPVGDDHFRHVIMPMHLG